MNLAKIQHIYFIGIGGIGMSALARYFKRLGKVVAGYDKTQTPLTNQLAAEGMLIFYSDAIDLIPDNFVEENTLVVITPAVFANHAGWNYFIERNYDIRKRAEVLGIITKETFCFAVAGTHGKTTTSAILGHILYSAGVDVTAFVGGIVENYSTNLIGHGTTVTVVEADEFDRSFLQLFPDIACITSTDADHLDIYGNAEEIQASFHEFAAKTSFDKLFIKQGLKLKGIGVGVNEPADYFIRNIKIEAGKYRFDAVTPKGEMKDLVFSLPGHHNLSNAMMAIAMAQAYGVTDLAIRSALASFKGIKRRFSYQVEKENLVYIDDYAHHPTEINAVYQAVRERYPKKKILAIFQPHLYSRTKDFADDFAKSLAAFDAIWLLDIYPARELPIAGVTSSWLMDKINNSSKKMVTKQNLISQLLKSDAEVIITIGAGDIGEEVATIKKALDEKN